jgi:diacylglycerol O-acyltransferase
MAKVSKEQSRLLGPSLMRDWMEYLPPRPFAWYSRRASERRSADRASPRMNLIVSNVRGPTEQIQIAGYPVTGLFSVGPLIDGCGLNFTVWSYRDQLNVSILIDPHLVGDLEPLTSALTSEFEELRMAVAPVIEQDSLPSAAAGPSDGSTPS